MIDAYSNNIGKYFLIKLKKSEDLFKIFEEDSDELYNPDVNDLDGENDLDTNLFQNRNSSNNVQRRHIVELQDNVEDDDDVIVNQQHPQSPLINNNNSTIKSILDNRINFSKILKRLDDSNNSFLETNKQIKEDSTSEIETINNHKNTSNVIISSLGGKNFLNEPAAKRLKAVGSGDDLVNNQVKQISSYNGNNNQIRLPLNTSNLRVHTFFRCVKIFYRH